MFDKRYPIILLDPPWPYYGQQDKWGAAAKFYKTMNISELEQFPIYELLYPHSIIFMWSTSPKLHDAMALLDSWNLCYRGIAFVWVKTKLDCKTPIKAQGVRPSIVKPTTEFVIAASPQLKGRPIPLSDESICQVILAPKQEHSRKPDAVQDRIEKMYPTCDKIELFARRTRNGWDSWGDEI